MTHRSQAITQAATAVCWTTRDRERSSVTRPARLTAAMFPRKAKVSPEAPASGERKATADREKAATVQLCNSVVLSAAEKALLGRLFRGCSKVWVEDGGRDGDTRVLRTVSFDPDGFREEPTITKIGKG